MNNNNIPIALTKDKDKDKDKGRNRATSFRSSLNIFDHSALVDVINFEKRYQRQKFYVFFIFLFYFILFYL